MRSTELQVQVHLHVHTDTQVQVNNKQLQKNILYPGTLV